MRLRGWVAWAAVGCSVALGSRDLWLASAGAAFGAALLAAWWVLGEFAATRERIRVAGEMSAALTEVQAARKTGVR